MKKIFISFLITVCLLNTIYSQTDHRTRETKIADIVMLLPAPDGTSHNKLMNELSLLGDVISDLAPHLADPGGNDAQIRYAVSGLAMYSSKDANKKASVAQSLCSAIARAKSDEIRDFLFIQLQYVAGNESVETAAGYLNNTRLSDAAARVLVRIGNEAAGKSLLNALNTLRGAQQITLVEALGDLRYQPATDAIAALAGSPDIKLQKAVLHALAEIASPASEKTLADAAEKVAYKFEPTDAAGSYILYLHNRLPGGADAAAKASRKMLNSLSDVTQPAEKSAALELVTLSGGEKAVGDIITALGSDNKSYRQAALKYSANVRSSKMYDALLKKAKSEKRPEAKAEIIAAFGIRGDKPARSFVFDCLSNTNVAVRKAAIISAGQLAGSEAVAPVIRAMNVADNEIAQTGKSTLLSIADGKKTNEIAAAVSQASVPAKVAFLEILAERRAMDQTGTIFAQTSSAEPSVRLAADKALASVVEEKDLPRVAQLLDIASNNEETAALQEAVYASVRATDPAKQTRLVSERMKASARPIAYYNVLAMIGDKEALDITVNGFRNSAAAHRSAAFEALSRWSNAAAAANLFEIAAADPSSPFFDKAVMSYVDKVSSSTNTPEQKLLLLRKALEIAPAPIRKQEILKQIARTSTFLGFITASKYLDDRNNDVRQAAVQTMITIVLTKPEYYGRMVTSLMNKALAVNENPEAEYQKQAVLKHLAGLPQGEGFVPMFNGKDLTGWKGLVENPIARSKMTPVQLADKQQKADEIMRRDWRAENEMLVFEGKGYDNLCSEKSYGDFEMFVDWRIAPKGDAGIYLRGSPQVQIWDITNGGAQVGSGGLFNNKKNPANPLTVADNPVDEWNSFYIKMIGEKVTVYLNGQLVVDNVTLENYWDRSLPIFSEDAIELQAHGTRTDYRNLYIREIARPKPYEVSAEEKAEGFVPMFNGIDMTGWTGNLKDYIAQDGMILCIPSKGGSGNLYTEKEYSDFIMRFEFQLTPAANNGLGIRTPLEGNPAYEGMELQILDNEADVYKSLEAYQYHGSVYGVIPAKRGYLKPTGEWNTQEVIAKGNRITITLNGTLILDGDIAEASKNFTKTADGQNHPGLSNKSGHIGFLGHGSELSFKDLRIKDLSKPEPKKSTKKKK